MLSKGAVDRLRATLGLDLRSLALLRILLGAMILVDLAVRAISLEAHYTDAGVLPRELLRRVYLDAHPYRFSFHMLSGDAGLQWALFVASAVFAVLLIIGRAYWLWLLLSWLLMCSVQNRNYMIETGGDYLLRLVCLWCLLLPIGAVWSAAKQQAPATARRVHHLSLATVGLFVQLSLVYWFSAIHKTHAQWRSEFSAVHYALHIDAYATPFGVWLRQFRGVTTALTHLVLGFEYAAPFFVYGLGLLSLLPGLERLARFQGPVRTATVFAFMGLHVGLGLGLALGTFPWFATLIWLGVLPSFFWEQLEVFARRRGWSRLSSLISGQPNSAAVAQAPAPAATPTWVWPARGLRHVVTGLAALMAVYVVLINLQNIKPRYRRIVRGQVALVPNAEPAIEAIRLDQHWGLFAPYPRTTDGFYVIHGKRADGSEVDLQRPDQRLTWERPEYVSSSYPNFRWRKYFRNIRRRGRSYELQRSALLTYHCNRYNRTHSGAERLETLDLVFMGRKTRREGGHDPIVRKTLWHRTCP